MTEMGLEVAMWPSSSPPSRHEPCRIDCFMDVATKAFGERMKEQVEERLRFYEDGIAPGKNIDAMQARSAAAVAHEILLSMPSGRQRQHSMLDFANLNPRMSVSEFPCMLWLAAAAHVWQQLSQDLLPCSF